MQRMGGYDAVQKVAWQCIVRCGGASWADRRVVAVQCEGLWCTALLVAVSRCALCGNFWLGVG